MYRRLRESDQYTMQYGSGLPLFNSIFLSFNSMIVIYLIKKSLVMTLSVAVVVMLSNAAENRSTFLSSLLNLLPLIFSAIFSPSFSDPGPITAFSQTGLGGQTLQPRNFMPNSPSNKCTLKSMALHILGVVDILGLALHQGTVARLLANLIKPLLVPNTTMEGATPVIIAQASLAQDMCKICWNPSPLV